MSQQYIEIELDGKTRLLRFDYNAVCDVEEKFGKGIGSILNTEQVGLRVLRVFYWAALRWKDQGLTLERVGQMLQKEIAENGTELKALFEPVLKALKQSKVLGDVKNDEEDESPNE